MVDADLEQPPADLYERISDRAALGPSCDFWVLYGSKRLEGDAALSSWGVKKGAGIEVKLRGRGAGKGTLRASWFRVSSRRGTGSGESSQVGDSGDGAHLTSPAQVSEGRSSPSREGRDEQRGRGEPRDHCHTPSPPEVQRLTRPRPNHSPPPTPPPTPAQILLPHRQQSWHTRSPSPQSNLHQP